MGVTIHFTLAQHKDYVKSTLDFAEKTAKNMLSTHAKALGIEYVIARHSDDHLQVDIGECESLIFNFKAYKDLDEWEKSERFFPFKVDRLSEDARICRGFCKTQYATSVAEHRFVADIIKVVASRCSKTNVSDEGDYYHSGDIDNASEAIEENGKMIDSLGGLLTQRFGAENVQKGGSTPIKSIKRKKL